MTKGHIVVARSRETKGIYVQTTEDLDEYDNDDMRVIYSQYISDIHAVQEKIDCWLSENKEELMGNDDINDVISEMVSSMQWIANDHPVRSFRRVAHNIN